MTKHLQLEDVWFLQTDPLLLYSFSLPMLAHSVKKENVLESRGNRHLSYFVSSYNHKSFPYLIRILSLEIV